MKLKLTLLITLILVLSSCTTQKKLTYLQNVPESAEEERIFPISIPNYRIQYRDILYITLKGMLADGTIVDFLSPESRTSGSYAQSEAGQYLFGYDVDNNGEILLPVMGKIKVGNQTLDEARETIQTISTKHFNNVIVECKLLSYKFTVIGEVKNPGTYFNYNNYLTIFEAIGRAGGISDFGKRNRITVIRSSLEGQKLYSLDLQNKSLLSSEAYFLMPNDVIIIEADPKKIFNLNLPIFSFALTSITSVITTTLLLINYFK